MIERNHPLTIGEKVFDTNVRHIYHITAINEDGTINLSMTDYDVAENKKMFDCEITEEDYEYVEDDPCTIYQFAKGIVDELDGNPVCYQHNHYYPYYSPYLNKNLFTFETRPEQQKNPVMGFDLPTNGLNDVLYTLGNFESCSTKDVPVVVEDENGRIEHISYMWYDPVRDMIRMSVKGVEFKDTEE